MNCFILGDKYQNGMKSKGCPALISLNNKTNIFSHQYSILSSLIDNINIFYIYGFDNKKFLDFYKKTEGKIPFIAIYNEQYNNYNQAFSLSLVKDIIAQDSALIIDGYQKLNKAVVKKILNSTISTILVNKNISRDSESVGCIIDQDSVVSLSLDLDNTIQSIYYLDHECTKNLSEILEDKKYHNNFVFELLNKLIDEGHTIKPIIL